MTTRARLAAVLLTAWVAVSVVVALVANLNFHTVDRVLAPGYRAELEARAEPLGPGGARTLLRYLAAELNRRIFRVWGWVQIGLTVLLVAVLIPEPAAGAGTKALALAGALLGCALALGVTPRMLRLGPPLDFVPRPVPPEWQVPYARFMRLHGVFFAADLLKLILLLAALVLVLRLRDRPRYAFGPGD